MLKRTLLATLFCLSLQAAGHCQDYTYYNVKPGDTLDSISTQLKVKPEEIRRLNVKLEISPGSVIFVPAPPAYKHVAGLPPGFSKHKADATEEKEESKPSRSSGGASPSRVEGKVEREMSDDDVDAIYESTVKSRARTVVSPVAMMSGTLPDHQNVFVNSDGQAIAVPVARPHVKEPEPAEKAAPDEETSHKRHSLTSRRAQKAQLLLRSALKYMGVPYVWGGEDPTGFDCSGFIQHVYASQGVRLPRTADLQYEIGQTIPEGKEQPGDLIFFETYCPGASHVGICLGHHLFVHASSSAGQITITDLRESPLRNCCLGYKRVW